MTTLQLLPGKLKAVGTLAIEQVGEVVGIRWRPVGTQERRSASVYFRYLDAARAFAKAARRVGFLAFDPTGSYQRLNETGDPITHPYEPVAYQGFAVLVLLAADSQHPSGWRPAPPFREQPAIRLFGHICEHERAKTTRTVNSEKPMRRWKIGTTRNWNANSTALMLISKPGGAVAATRKTALKPTSQRVSSAKPKRELPHGDPPGRSTPNRPLPKALPSTTPPRSGSRRGASSSNTICASPPTMPRSSQNWGAGTATSTWLKQQPGCSQRERLGFCVRGIHMVRASPYAPLAAARQWAEPSAEWYSFSHHSLVVTRDS